MSHGAPPPVISLAGPRRIGANRREAIDWIQDLLQIQRPLAEATVFDQLRARRLVATDFGMLLFETDEDIEHRSQRLSHDHNRRGIRLRFRNRQKIVRKVRVRREQLSYQPQNRGPKSPASDDDAGGEATL